MAKHLHKGDEAHRRWKIIDAPRAADASLLPQLLVRLDGDESYDTSFVRWATSAVLRLKRISSDFWAHSRG
jgi:hypothetical protein